MKHKRNQTTLRLTEEIDFKLTSIARQMGVSKNAVISMILDRELKKAI